MSDPRILLVEMQDGYPFSVFVEDGMAASRPRVLHYDFDYCRRDDCAYFDCAGSGFAPWLERPAENSWWAAEGLKVANARPELRLTELPAPYTLETLFEEAGESDTEWCEECQDRIPVNRPCEHIWDCEECAWWSTPCTRASGECTHPREVAA